MENLFEEIMGKCNRKEVISLCKKLVKKLSFGSWDDVENLCHLTYWLYILNEKELAKKCIELTHNVPFDGNYNVWTFIDDIWGLEIRILREESKNNEADEIIKTMGQHDLSTDTGIDLKKLRNRFALGIESGKPMEVSYQQKVETHLAENDLKGANRWRFIALFGLMGRTATGFYPNLNNDKEKIEDKIKEYINEILK